MLFSVRTRLLAAIAKWAHQGDDRPHLARVLFDGKHMVACDGHRLVVATCETGVPPFALDRLDCAVLAAAQREITKRYSAELGFVSVADGKVAIELETGRVLTVKAREAGEFPPWQKLLEDAKAETPAPPEYAFDPRYLAAIDEVIQGAAGGEYQNTVKVKAWAGLEPGAGCAIGPMLFESVVFDDNCGCELRFLIMPKRS